MIFNLDIKTQVLPLIIAFVGLIITMTLTRKITQKVSLVKRLEANRKKVVLNLFYFLYYLIFMAIVTIILGIDLRQISLFLSSILAVLGVAFFAQWSLLSNLTASVIIFFYYPLKIGDHVKILDKEFDFIGKVKNITGFYVLIVTKDKREITIPNSIILQKGIEYLHTDSAQLKN